jgi:hypothetical protein
MYWVPASNVYTIPSFLIWLLIFFIIFYIPDSSLLFLNYLSLDIFFFAALNYFSSNSNLAYLNYLSSAANPKANLSLFLDLG